MPLVEKHLWSDDELDAALVLTDTLLFALTFWDDELTIPENRLDLPEAWRGRQVISKEQRIMCLAGCDYMVFRDTAPELAARSSRKVAYRTSRKIAKTLFMEARMMQIPLLKSSKTPLEGMIHTPGDRQMAPLMDRYEKKLVREPFFALMHRSMARDSGIDNWKNGWTWHWRIEGSEARAGYAMVGLRAYAMMGDEGDYANEKAYVEREQTALPGCYQYWGGVPRGVRGVFWSECRNPRSGWSVFRFDMRANPLYHSPQAWEDQVKGDWNSQRVQTQVLGRDGEVAVSSFPVIPVDASLPFVVKAFNETDYQNNAASLTNFLGLPVGGVVGAEAWMIHLDYGFSPSPTELGVSYYRKGVWFTLGRFEIRQVEPVRMAHIINLIDQQILPKPASLILVDAHGQGFGVLSALQQEPRFESCDYTARAIDVGFASTTKLPGVFVHSKCGSRVHTVGDERQYVCDRCNTTIWNQKDLREASLPTKMYLTDEMKSAMSEGKKWLDTGHYPSGVAFVMGNDSVAIDELTGTTEITRPSGQTLYIPPQEGVQHITDHLRCLVSGALRFSQIQNQGPATSILEFGWMKAPGLGGGEWNFT